MSVRIGNFRVGHRVGGFYVSGTVTGRNAGKQLRIGHRLPLGFWGSVPIRLSGSRRPQRPIGSIPPAGMVTGTLLYVGAALGLFALGAWFLAVPVVAAIVVAWLRWAANPQQRAHSRP